MNGILYGQQAGMANVIPLPVRRPAGLALSDDSRKTLVGIGAALVLAGATWGVWKMTR